MKVIWAGSNLVGEEARTQQEQGPHSEVGTIRRTACKAELRNAFSGYPSNLI